jgi:hypothetical protein
MGDWEWVGITPDGGVSPVSEPGGKALATIVVKPVTDALKKRSGDRIAGALRRDEMWIVESYILNSVVIEGLEDSVTVDELVEAVRRLGHDWQVSQP